MKPSKRHGLKFRTCALTQNAFCQLSAGLRRCETSSPAGAAPWWKLNKHHFARREGQQTQYSDLNAEITTNNTVQFNLANQGSQERSPRSGIDVDLPQRND